MRSYDEDRTFISHLDELRKRLIICVVAIFATTITSFIFSKKLLEFVVFPMSSKGRRLVFLTPTEAFMANVKVSLITGLIVAMPVILFECWRFINPALKEGEKQYFIPVMLLSVILFFGGVSFCFFFVLPYGLDFLLSYELPNMKGMISIGSYVSFVGIFILVFGIVFELPLFIYFLTKIGIVNHEMLKKKRKYAVIGAFILAAVLTPTVDPFTQVLMAVPIILLYEIGILLAYMTKKKPKEDIG